MRVMLRVCVPTEEGNRAIKDGSLAKGIEKALAELKPEAAYFTTERGKRTAYLFIDMSDISDMPFVAERFFFAFNAEVDFVPAMKADELKRGLPKAMSSLA